jgi:hypothetical protein
MQPIGCIKLDTHLPYDYDARLHKPLITVNTVVFLNCTEMKYFIVVRFNDIVVRFNDIFVRFSDIVVKLPDDGNRIETCSSKLIIKYIIYRIVHMLALLESVNQYILYLLR